MSSGAGYHRTALDQELPGAYHELRRAAHRLLARRRSGDLQTTELVHEVYCKFVRQHALHWTDRSHLVRLATSAMRQVLVDQRRRRQAAKRGGDDRRITWDDCLRAASGRPRDLDEMLAVHEALADLEEIDPRLVRVVELRVFGGMERAEIGELLGVSEATVKRDWSAAKAWLARQLARHPP